MFLYQGNKPLVKEILGFQPDDFSMSLRNRCSLLLAVVLEDRGGNSWIQHGVSQESFERGPYDIVRKQ